jgi:hypothetical protein
MRGDASSACGVTVSRAFLFLCGDQRHQLRPAVQQGDRPAFQPPGQERHGHQVRAQELRAARGQPQSVILMRRILVQSRGRKKGSCHGPLGNPCDIPVLMIDPRPRYGRPRTRSATTRWRATRASSRSSPSWATRIWVDLAGLAPRRLGLARLGANSVTRANSGTRLLGCVRPLKLLPATGWIGWAAFRFWSGQILCARCLNMCV